PRAVLGVIKIGRVRKFFQLRRHDVRPLFVRRAEYVDAYSAAHIDVTFAVGVEKFGAFAPDKSNGKARIRGGDIRFVRLLSGHNSSSPDTNIVPIPASVSVSMMME